MPALVGTAAIEFRLPDSDGALRSLVEFHPLGPVVLLFLPRVRGWRSRWQFWGLLRHCDEFVRRGAEIVVVAPDPVPELRIFQIQRALPFVFLSDLTGSVAAAYHPCLARGGAGALVIGRTGVVEFSQLRRHGRRCSARRLLRALRRV